jgi:hypothetical protein
VIFVRRARPPVIVRGLTLTATIFQATLRCIKIIGHTDYDLIAGPV